MTQQTLTRLRSLKLTNMAEALQQQLKQASTYEGLPFIERLSPLVEHEQLSREQRKQTRLVRQARLKLQATVQGLDYQPGHKWRACYKVSGCTGAKTYSLPAPVAVAKPIWPVRWATKPASKGIALVTTGYHVCCLS